MARLKKITSVGSRTGISSTEHLHRSGEFLFTDSLVLLLLGGSLQALPWEATQVEVH